MVLACALAETPGANIQLVERNAKKAAFLREAIRVTSAAGTVHLADIGDIVDRIAGPVDCVTARALAPLHQLIGFAEPLVGKGAKALFLKGQDVEAELTEATKYWNIEPQLHSSRTGGHGWIVELDRIERRNQAATGHWGTNVIDEVYQEDRAPAAAGHPRILSLANQKGGVGKTTTAINLGTALAAIGERVLIVDLDPQGNASTGLGIDRRNRNCSTYDVLIGEAPLREAVVVTAVPRLHIAASTMDLSGLELELGTTPGRAFRLRDAIAALNNDAAPGADYTYVLIDCPPSLNLLTVNAMAASDAILVPLQCEFFALEGLSQLLQTVEQVRSTLNPNLSIHGIVLTMFDSRNNLSNQVVADVRQFMGAKVYNTMIPRNVRISEAPSYGKPVLVYDLKCVGSDAYLKLATEVIQRERELRTH